MLHLLVPFHLNITEGEGCSSVMRAEGEIGPSRAANNKNLHQHLSIASALL